MNINIVVQWQGDIIDKIASNHLEFWRPSWNPVEVELVFQDFFTAVYIVKISWEVHAGIRKWNTVVQSSHTESLCLGYFPDNRYLKGHCSRAFFKRFWPGGHFLFWCPRMASAVARACKGFWGFAPSGVQGQNPWSGGQGDEVPLKLTRFFSFKYKFM